MKTAARREALETTLVAQAGENEGRSRQNTTEKGKSNKPVRHRQYLCCNRASLPTLWWAKEKKKRGPATRTVPGHGAKDQPTCTRGHETRRSLVSLRRNQPEPRVLVEVRAEVIPREHARQVAAADEAPAGDDVVLPVEAGGRKVLQEGGESRSAVQRERGRNRGLF